MHLRNLAASLDVAFLDTSLDEALLPGFPGM
jgi:hypothetical protein